MDIAFFTPIASDLGESPVWDGQRQWLWWIDIRKGRVMAVDTSGTLVRDWTFDRQVGSIGLAEDGLVAAFSDGFSLIDLDGRVRDLVRPTIGEGAIRFNDGKMDRQGRFLSGTMQHGGQEGALGTLWRLGRGGDAEKLLDGFRLTNSLCFSPCGRWLYVSDSLEGVLRRYPYDPETGALGPMKSLFDFAAAGTAPDGATVDSEGRIWVALVISAQIACLSAEGELLRLVDLPVPYPSCPAFGGPDMATLYVTTISDSGHKLKSDHPDAGRMLAISGLGARGIGEARFVRDNHTWN
ncbi:MULTISPECIES: SMP-30/gluconolactonase/LRE family protein [Novosphingobium]|uniref:SMP-30/gluconolactonase/LRE family protein n=1 Tax=Novosphingobium sp. ST904 TaxID=1684385 RepID=UPI0006C8876E|nr:SMP-30/gluconolactonase/LRE family protein [Novosphingobium sp. ST904]KPH68469.1 hypothetical protein ADT71_01165 [Novosphingobium sp. ST904]TCM25449.1 sugar lactone lactonase YvrE [Novosphingobium sp. ST904]